MQLCCMPLRKEIGKTVRRLRKEKRKTQEQLAKAACIAGGSKYIGKIEAGTGDISVQYLLYISKGLEISLIDLLKEVDYDGIITYKKPKSLLEIEKEKAELKKSHFDI